MVLKDAYTEEKVMCFAAELDLEALRDVAADPALGLTRHVIWRITPGIVLEYAADSRSRCSFLAVGGYPRDLVQEIEKSIEKNLKPWTLREVLSAVDRADGVEELAGAVLRAGVAAPQGFDKKMFKSIKRAILHIDHRIRYAGLWATAYSRWSEFRDLIAGVADGDELYTLRRDAQVILHYYSS